MMWDYFGLWLVGCLCLQLAALKSGRAFRSGATASPMLATNLALLVQHASVAAQASAFAAVVMAALPPEVAPWVLGWVWAGSMLLLGVDTWLQVHFGLRLERGYIHFLRELRLFDARWAVHLAACVALTLCLGGMVGFWLLLGAADVQALHALELWSAVAVGAFVLGLIAWRRLPTAATFGWNNRLFAMQMAALLQAWRRRPAAAVPAGVPELLASHNEEADFIDARYPLLRRTRRFVGDKHFEVRLEEGERPHVVMLFIESFGARDIGALGSPHQVTPCFDAWSRQGVLWNNFYANGTSTARGALAGLYGLPPRFSELSAQAHEPPHCIGLPDLFSRRGYRSAYFHNGPSLFEAKNPFFFDHGFASLHDRIAIGKCLPGAKSGEWGLHDEYLMQFHLDWLRQRDEAGMPTFSTLFTVTNHHPFDVPEHAEMLPEDIHPNVMYRRYLRAMRYSDACLGTYLEGLRQQGLAEKTIVLVLADTGQEYQDDGGQGLTYSGRLTAAATRIPLLLLAPGRLDAPRVIDEMASQVDLMPTLMDLFGMHETHHGVGSSLVRVCADRRPYLVNGHAPQFMALQQRPWNYTYSFEVGLGSLHNIELDPREVRDVADGHAATVAAARQQVLAMRAFTDERYASDTFAPPDSATTYPLPHIPPGPDGLPPEGYPFSIADMQRRCDVLKAIETPTIEMVRERRFLRMYLTCGLSEADKLLAAQLQFKQTYVQEYGILTVAENEERLRIQKLIDDAIWVPRGGYPGRRPKDA